MTPVMPSKHNRQEPRAYDQTLDKLREKIERFFHRLKQFGRIATRYDQLRTTYLAFLHVVVAFLAIQSFVNTP